ncbi:hypothetical protein CYMTET_52578, partial [Cymbomonas tetramitiformis]
GGICSITFCGFEPALYTLRGGATFIGDTFPVSDLPPPMVLLVDLPYIDKYEETAMTVNVAPDEDAPVITLLGAAYVELNQWDAYTDAGATVYDARDGYIKATVDGLEAVDTCCATPAAAPHILTYRAQDAAGNSAVPVTRQVAVLPFCDWPSYPCEGLERTCASCTPAEDGSDEVNCICLDDGTISTSQTAPVVLAEYIPPVDTVPPAMTLLGTGKLGITSLGVVVMLDILQVGDSWEDPGVLVTDDVDGNLSVAVSSFGAAAVETSEATPADRPFAIRYTCQDGAGNAVEMRRFVSVENPCAGAGEDGADERMCATATNGSVTCSAGGLCTTLDLESEEEPAAPAEPPVLQLLGPGAVTVAQGEVYAACPAEGRRLDLVCDQGAAAIDLLDRDLTARVLACSPDGITAQFANAGVSVCGVDTHTPGVYAVNFSVSNSLGLVGVASRHVTVTTACPVGEVLCSNGLECSVQGVCLGDLTGKEEEVVQVDTPPSVVLLTTLAVPKAMVEVKQHQVYAACAPGQPVDDLCEPGAVAYDQEDGDLSASLLACPPASCLDIGCPGHEWAKKGLEGCVNTSAAVGSIFNIDFVVFDSAIPANFHAATRVVGIIQPCAVGEELCADLTCSSVDCELRDSLLADPRDVMPPEVALRYSEVRVRYGRAEDVAALRACTSKAELTQDPPSCVATAVDDESGDISSSLATQQDFKCSACSTELCALKSVHHCLPGRYGFLFEASDGQGNRGVARLLVTLVEEAMVTAETLISLSTSAAEAEEQVDALRNSSSLEASAFAEGIAEMLNNWTTSAGEAVTASDVVVVAVDAQDSVAGQFSLAVTFTTVVFTTVASTQQDGRQQYRRRVMEQQGSGVLAARSRDVAVTLTAAAEDGRMSASLARAAASSNASLATEVVGPVGEASYEALTPEVDLLATYMIGIEQSLANLKRGSGGLDDTLAEALDTVGLAGGNPAEWNSRLTAAWLRAEEGDAANIEALAETAGEIAEKLVILIQSYELSQVKAATLRHQYPSM